MGDVTTLGGFLRFCIKRASVKLVPLGVLSPCVPADPAHANGGLGRRESQGSMTSAGSLDLVSPRKAVSLVRELLHGWGGRPLSSKNISGFISETFSSRSGTFLWTPTGASRYSSSSQHLHVP